MDAADPAARAGLFKTLREEVARMGAFGASPEAALPHLESAIARQEVHWLRETGQSVELPPPAPSRPVSPPLTRVAPQWRWPEEISVPLLPTSEVPGDATGPFADHLYEDVMLDTPGGTTRLTISWAFDPACTLSASAEEIGFHFRARTATLSGALDQLDVYLNRGGLSLPAEARTRIR